mgnify:CR=1 FL=1
MKINLIINKSSNKDRCILSLQIVAFRQYFLPSHLETSFSKSRVLLVDMSWHLESVYFINYTHTHR